jgi:hypothetical protein
VSCPNIVDVEYPSTFTSDAAAQDGGVAVPNPGAGCAASTGVIRLKQGVAARVRIPLRDETGRVVEEEFGSSESPPVAVLHVREAAWTRCLVEAEAETIDGGYAIFEIDGMRYPGLYEASMVVSVDGEEVAETRYLVEVAAMRDRRNRRDPLSIAELRLELRDQCAGQNELLDRLEFTDEQVAWAIRKPVDEFNATNQPRTTYTVSTFPGAWRAMWAMGSVGYLLRVASIGRDRDGLQYSAGGVTIDDKNFAYVSRLSQQLLDDWRRWVVMKKVEINVDGAWGSLGSDYGSGAWN